VLYAFDFRRYSPTAGAYSSMPVSVLVIALSIVVKELVQFSVPPCVTLNSIQGLVPDQMLNQLQHDKLLPGN